jgi:hypothetical protein
LFHALLLNREVSYQECDHCGYVQTQQPDWLEEAYTHALNDTDTGIVRRSLRCARIVSATLSVLGQLHKPMVDHAGGSGLLVRMLRDLGIDARWHDPHCANVFARGFEYQGEPVGLLSAFEVLEHLVHPLEELRRWSQSCDAMLFSTELIPQPTPPAADWWYYGPEHGQHIGFLRRQTLQFIATSLGWHLQTDGRQFHLLTRKPLANWRWTLARQASKPLHLWARLRLKSLTTADHRRLSAKP